MLEKLILQHKFVEIEYFMCYNTLTKRNGEMMHDLYYEHFA